MKYKIIVLIVYAIFSSFSLHAMRRARAVHAKTNWPPLLWSTYQSKQELAQQLSRHNISVANFIKGQLLSAREQTLVAIQEEAQVSLTDLKAIKSIVSIVKEHDARHGHVSFLHKKDPYQEEMHDHFSGVQIIADDFNLATEIDIMYDSEFPQDVYYQRSPEGIIFTLDNTLVLAQPHAHEYTSRPELHIGPAFFQLHEHSQWGAISRLVAGHIAYEHAIERYLLKEVMRKGKGSTKAITASLQKLRVLHALEADLTPASLNKHYASCVFSWLKTQKYAPNTPHFQERLTNIQTVGTLHAELEKVNARKN